MMNSCRHKVWLAPLLHLCILLGNNAWLTLVSDMLGWIIQGYTNCGGTEREPNKCNTCFGDRTNIQSTFVNSFIAAATAAQASEHINQPGDCIHLPLGHGSPRAGDPRAVGTASACAVPPLLLPVLTVVPVRQAGEGESDKLGGMLGLLSGEACLALTAGAKMRGSGRDIDAHALAAMQHQSKRGKH